MSRPVEVILCIVLYTAVMVGIAWALGLFVPGVKEWSDGTFGKGVSALILFSTIPICWGLVRYLERR